MKPRIIIILSLALVTCALLLWISRAKRPSPAADSGTETDARAVSATVPAIPTSEQTATAGRTAKEGLKGIAGTNGVAASVSTQQSSEQASTQYGNLRQRALENINEDLKWPINFYGKVIDQSGRAVAEANVKLSWQTAMPTGYIERTTKSDTNGHFELKDASGRTLFVSVEKLGYYASKSNLTTFDYSQKNNSAFIPDPNNPVVFLLEARKMPHGGPPPLVPGASNKIPDYILK